MLLFGPKQKRSLYDYFARMNPGKFESLWYQAHDNVGGLSLSGFKYDRIITLVVNFEPNYFTAEELLQ